MQVLYSDRVLSRRLTDPLEMAGIIDAHQRVKTSAPLDDVHCPQALMQTAKTGNLQSEDLAQYRKIHEIMPAKEHRALMVSLRNLLHNNPGPRLDLL